jgi:hypothetical protein
VTREKGKNTAASVRARLLSLAQTKAEDYQRVLGRYAIERFLYRLGRSPWRTSSCTTFASTPMDLTKLENVRRKVCQPTVF